MSQCQLRSAQSARNASSSGVVMAQPLPSKSVGSKSESTPLALTAKKQSALPIKPQKQSVKERADNSRNLSSSPLATRRKQKAVLPRRQQPISLQQTPTRTIPRMKPQPAIRNRELPNERHPSIKGQKTTTSSKIRDRLKAKSPWYLSIENPLEHAGSKIPDAFGTATATNQMVYDTTVDVNANGVAGLRVVSPYPNSETSTGGPGYNYQTTSAASTSANVLWGDGTTPLGGLPFPSNATFVGYAQGVRIVSACVMAMPEMSTLSDQGEMCAFVTPFGHSNVSPLPYSTIVSLYDSTPIALNKHKSVKASWYPAEMIDADGYSRDYRDFISPAIVAEGDPDPFPYWEFGVIASGATANAGKIRFRIVVNYEWVPVYNSLDVVSCAPSPVDIEEEEFVCAEMQSRFPVTSVIPDKALSTAPTVAPVASGEQNQTGFGFFAEILMELAPQILTAIL